MGVNIRIVPGVTISLRFGISGLGYMLAIRVTKYCDNNGKDWGLVL